MCILHISTGSQLNIRDDYIKLHSPSKPRISTFTQPNLFFSSTGESFDSKNNLIATVDYEGNILWDTVVVTSTFCKLLVRFFPFDVQHCNITLTPWIHNRKQVSCTNHLDFSFPFMKNSY